MRVSTLRKSIEGFCADRDDESNVNRYQLKKNINSPFTYSFGCPSCGPGNQLLRNYDLTFSAGGMKIYVETQLGEILHNGSFYGLNNNDDVPRRTTVGKINKLKEARERKREELKARLESEEMGNTTRNTIGGSPTLFINDWAMYGLGSVNAPIVDYLEDAGLDSATIVSAHAQYDVSNYMDGFKLEEFAHPFDKIKLRQISKDSLVKTEASIVNNLCLNDSNNKRELQHRNMDSIMVFGTNLPINNATSAISRIEKLALAGEKFLKYYFTMRHGITRI